ncbi:MAG: phosphoribosylanthranilate isomerase [bacterium]
MVKIKICGITSPEDLKLSVDAGADAVGFVFYPSSPRYVKPESVADWLSLVPAFVSTVGVTVDLPAEEIDRILSVCPLDYLQFHGKEPLSLCQRYGRKAIKAFRVQNRSSLTEIRAQYAGLHTILLDAYKQGVPGGTGQTFNWELAGEAGSFSRIILSGGLRPENVRQALNQARPYGVDVSTGVEECPGRKSPQKLERFCRAAGSWKG